MLADDALILSHEVGHAVMAVIEGFTLLWVNANRHTRLDDHGVTECIVPDDATPEARARFLLARQYGEPWTTARQASGDMEKVRAAWAQAGSPADWIEARRAEVAAVFARDEVRRATNVLASAVEANGLILSGVQAEEVVRACLW